jgi:hypothetical protein
VDKEILRHKREKKAKELERKSGLWQPTYCHKCHQTGCMCPREPRKVKRDCRHINLTIIKPDIARELVPSYTFTDKDRIRACNDCHRIIFVNETKFGE